MRKVPLQPWMALTKLPTLPRFVWPADRQFVTPVSTQYTPSKQTIILPCESNVGCFVRASKQTIIYIMFSNIYMYTYLAILYYINRIYTYVCVCVIFSLYIQIYIQMHPYASVSESTSKSVTQTYLSIFPSDILGNKGSCLQHMMLNTHGSESKESPK